MGFEFSEMGCSLWVVRIVVVIVVCVDVGESGVLLFGCVV